MAITNSSQDAETIVFLPLVLNTQRELGIGNFRPCQWIFNSTCTSSSSSTIVSASVTDMSVDSACSSSVAIAAWKDYSSSFFSLNLLRIQETGLGSDDVIGATSESTRTSLRSR